MDKRSYPKLLSIPQLAMAEKEDVRKKSCIRMGVERVLELGKDTEAARFPLTKGGETRLNTVPLPRGQGSLSPSLRD